MQINQLYTSNIFSVFIMTLLLVVGIGSHYLSVFFTSSVILFPRNMAHNGLYCEPSTVCKSRYDMNKAGGNSELFVYLLFCEVAFVLKFKAFQ